MGETNRQTDRQTDRRTETETETQEHSSEVFHKICVPHCILCGLANYSMLDCWLEKSLLSWDCSGAAPLDRNEAKFAWSRLDQGRENETFNDFSFFSYSLHMSLAAGREKKLIMILLGEIF